MSHHCHLPGCIVPTPRRFLFCPRHWKLVPPHLKTKVWIEYRKAGGTTGPCAVVTQGYLDVVRTAQQAVLARLALGNSVV